jgi:hypothetical protein
MWVMVKGMKTLPSVEHRQKLILLSSNLSIQGLVLLVLKQILDCYWLIIHH